MLINFAVKIAKILHRRTLIKYLFINILNAVIASNNNQRP